MMPLTVGTMRQILAAAFSVDEGCIRPTLDALTHGGLIPMGDDVALDAWHVAAVMLAYLAWVPPHAVAPETMRLASFRSPAMGGATVGLLLAGRDRDDPRLARPRAGYCA